MPPPLFFLVRSRQKEERIAVLSIRNEAAFHNRIAGPGYEFGDIFGLEKIEVILRPFGKHAFDDARLVEPHSCASHCASYWMNEEITPSEFQQLENSSLANAYQ